jgi:Cu/Ag efflux pump CusA
MTKEKLVANLQKEFEDAFPGVTTNFSQYIQDNVQEGLSGVKGANSVTGTPLALQYQSGTGVALLTEGSGTYYLTIIHTK